MTYWRLHYHLIWATFERQPLLTVEREKMFYGVIYRKAKELGLKIHAAGAVDDHVHIVVSIPPKISVADCVRHLKGASAYAINHMDGSNAQFKWQAMVSFRLEKQRSPRSWRMPKTRRNTTRIVGGLMFMREWMRNKDLLVFIRRDKAPAQDMKALRASARDEPSRVGLSRLP